MDDKVKIEIMKKALLLIAYGSQTDLENWLKENYPEVFQYKDKLDISIHIARRTMGLISSFDNEDKKRITSKTG